MHGVSPGGLGAPVQKPVSRRRVKVSWEAKEHSDAIEHLKHQAQARGVGA